MAFSWRAQDDLIHLSGSSAGTDDRLGFVGTADQYLRVAQGRCLKRATCRSMAFYHLLQEVTQLHFLYVVTVTTRRDLRGQRFRPLLGGTSHHQRPG